MGRRRWSICLAAALLGGVEHAEGQVNDSFVWCEPRTALTYCLELTTPALIRVTDQAAAQWNAGSPWTLTKVAACAGADIVVREQAANIFLRILAQAQNDTLGTFAQTRDGSEDVGGVIKPCLDRGTITYFPNVFPAGFNPLSLALHEFGHALRLLDGNNPNAVMNGVNRGVVVLANEDKQNAALSSTGGNINQLHRNITPEGGVLAFGGFELTLPPGALPAPGTVVGIRPLLASSIPAAALPDGFDQVVAAADVVPEYSLGEFEVGAPFTLKTVALAAPATLRVEVAEEALARIPEVSLAPCFRARPPDAIRTGLRLARLDPDLGSWLLLEAERPAAAPAVLAAGIDALGTFAVLGAAYEPPPPHPPRRTDPLPWLAAVAAAFLLGLLACRLTGRRERA
jgi:hypothetical protein